MKTLRYIPYTITAASLLLLQSCFVAKEYEGPETEIAVDSLYRTENVPVDSSSLAQISWKEFFKDPLLSAYIAEGLENNQDIRIALQQILAAEAYVKQGNQGYLPTLSTTVRGTHQELARNSQFGAFFDGSLQNYELLGNLSWEADIWGKIRSNQRAFRASYLQTAAAHRAVKSSLVAGIANLYYTLQTLDKQLAKTNETIATRQERLETSKALKESGSLTSVAVSQSEAQLYTAQTIATDLQRQIRETENALCLLLGRTPQSLERSEIEVLESQDDLPTGFPVQLLAQRPDVMQAEFSLINAFELSNVARSQFYPSLTVTATGGLQSIDFDKWFDAGSLFASITAGLTQPLLNGRRIRTQYEVALAQQEQARLQFEKTLLQAGAEVSDALFAVENYRNKIALQQKERDAYARAFTDASLLLDNGLANYLEVLNAQEQVLNSELSLIESRRALLTSKVTLYRALGGGWQ